jgi:hypothetical protein
MWCGCSERWTGLARAVPLDRRQALKLLATVVAAGCGATVALAAPPRYSSDRRLTALAMPTTV